MNDAKYIGLDVHQATVSAAVLDSTGKLVMESILETKGATILQFFRGLRGSVHVAFEEGTCAPGYDLLKPHVTKVLVCDPRKNSLLKAGNKNDRIDARKLADLLRSGLLSPVYHGENGLRTLRELARSYLAVTRDLTRVMNRMKALYRSWAIPCAGQQVYAPRYPIAFAPNGNCGPTAVWLCRPTAAGEYRFVEGQLQRSKRPLAIRGLNTNHNHDLKNIFKGAAIRAAVLPGPFQEFYAALVARGMKPSMARLTLARKIAAITLLVWKKGVRFDAEHLKQQAA